MSFTMHDPWTCPDHRTIVALGVGPQEMAGSLLVLRSPGLRSAVLGPYGERDQGPSGPVASLRNVAFMMGFLRRLTALLRRPRRHLVVSDNRVYCPRRGDIEVDSCFGCPMFRDMWNDQQSGSQVLDCRYRSTRTTVRTAY